MSIAESIWQSLLSQGTTIAVFVTVAYLFRDAILRFINDKSLWHQRKSCNLESMS